MEKQKEFQARERKIRYFLALEFFLLIDLIEMDYGDDPAEDEDLKEKLKQKQKDRESVKSKVDSRVGDLVKLLFDLKMFESTLVEMELDIKKMPYAFYKIVWLIL